MSIPPKADGGDFLGRFREVVSDPLNLLIERVPEAGSTEDRIVCLHNGVRVPYTGEGAYYGSSSELLVINRGVHEPLEEYVFQEMLKHLPEAPVMLELGAYWGHYSMWLQKKRPKATVILVEPDAKAQKAGIDNFQRNGFTGEFILAGIGSGFNVDPFMAERGLPALTVLHADIQGYEVEMIMGASVTLSAHRVDYVFISTHAQDIHAHTAGALQAMGYRIEVSSDFDDETTSCDGFIFASSPRVKKVFTHFKPLGRSEIAASRPQDLVKSLLEIKPATDAG